MLFAPQPALDVEVADAFAKATRSVGLDQTQLGIVRAAVDQATAVSRAPELSADEGSGYWLRRLGVERSVAVPVFERQVSGLWGVLSVGIPSEGPNEGEIEKRVQEAWDQLQSRSNDV